MRTPGSAPTGRTPPRRSLRSWTTLIDSTLPRARRSSRALRARIVRIRPGVVDKRGVLAIDAQERAEGSRTGRPRAKLTTREALVRAARATG